MRQEEAVGKGFGLGANLCAVIRGPFVGMTCAPGGFDGQSDARQVKERGLVHRTGGGLRRCFGGGCAKRNKDR